jgi:drug/metabolite transporter (DMT)-like permease
VGGGPAIAWLPCVVVIVGQLFWAIGSVVRKNFDLPKTSMITAGGEMVCGGFLLLALGGAIGEWGAVPRPTAGALIAMGYLIVAGSIIAYNSYVWLLGRTSATRLASYTYVNPVVALALGFQFGHERLTPHAVYGSLLVLVSVALVLRATRGHDKRAATTPTLTPNEPTHVPARVT